MSDMCLQGAPWTYSPVKEPQLVKIIKTATFKPHLKSLEGIMRAYSKWGNICLRKSTKPQLEQQNLTETWPIPSFFLPQLLRSSTLSQCCQDGSSSKKNKSTLKYITLQMLKSQNQTTNKKLQTFENSKRKMIHYLKGFQKEKEQLCLIRSNRDQKSKRFPDK